ncbi:unnamed protein product [Moneuplotes crassus]|uniref:Uncharacterized protein n=1 Tax=Euplotes crassus TaxID=5936 RepID=A0AAD1XYN1_EUPCR|nr:unnamed protein product [Moneuplotes crassus]
MALYPLILSLLDCFPAEVRPLHSLCFCLSLQIQLILGSFPIIVWNGSIMMIS